MKAAAIQMRSGLDVAKNIAAVSALIRASAADGAQLVCTPEMTHLLEKNADNIRRDVRAMDDDTGVAAFSALSAELSIHLLIGSIAVLHSDGKIANRSLLFAPDGRLTAQYDKIHLFEAAISKTESYREADTYMAGSQPVTAQIDDIKAGFSICYDLRFSAMYGEYAKQGVDLITVPAAFTVATGKAHWETLLRARAIETGAYVIAPAQGGQHADGRRTWGRTMIVDPWGEVVSKLDHDTPGYILADIDRAKVQNARARVPAWRGDSL